MPNPSRITKIISNKSTNLWNFESIATSVVAYFSFTVGQYVPFIAFLFIAAILDDYWIDVVKIKHPLNDLISDKIHFDVEFEKSGFWLNIKEEILITNTQCVWLSQYDFWLQETMQQILHEIICSHVCKLLYASLPWFKHPI